MLMPLRPLLVVPALLWASPANAQEWRVVDLGRLHKEAHCMAAAERTFTDLLAEARIAGLRRSGWVVYADRIEDGGRHDALVTCTFGDGRGTRATLVIHAARPTPGMDMLARRLGELFAWHARRITEAWKASFR